MESSPGSQRRIDRFLEIVNAEEGGNKLSGLDSLPLERELAANEPLSQTDDAKEKTPGSTIRTCFKTTATELATSSTSSTQPPAATPPINHSTKSSASSYESHSDVFPRSSPHGDDQTTRFPPTIPFSSPSFPRQKKSTSPQRFPVRLSHSTPNSPRVSCSPPKTPMSSSPVLKSPRCSPMHHNTPHKSITNRPSGTPALKITPASPSNPVTGDLPPVIREEGLLSVPGAHVRKPTVDRSSQRGPGSYWMVLRKTLSSVFCCCSSGVMTSSGRRGENRVAPKPHAVVKLTEQVESHGNQKQERESSGKCRKNQEVPVLHTPGHSGEAD